jgi:hypothetical protein
VRVADPFAGCIGYKLNILGVRVLRDHCLLIAKDAAGKWAPLGPSRSLPLQIPDDPGTVASDALLLTVYQYDLERPGSDLRAVLAQTKNFDVALNENANASTSTDSLISKAARKT